MLTLEEYVIVLPDFLLDEAVLILGLEADEGLDEQLASEWRSAYFSRCSSGSGGLELDLREGADSTSSSSVADLKLLFWSVLRLKGSTAPSCWPLPAPPARPPSLWLLSAI